MEILDNIIILTLPVLAFIAGKRISDSYNSKLIDHYQYLLRLQAAREGVGYVAPPHKRMPIGQQFMDKLKENGRATQQITSHNNANPTA